MPSLETRVMVFMTLMCCLLCFLLLAEWVFKGWGSLPSYEVLQEPFHAQGILHFYQVSKTVNNRLAVYI